MKIFYVHIIKDITAGVSFKILQQILMWEKLNYEVYPCFIVKKGVNVELNKKGIIVYYRNFFEYFFIYRRINKIIEEKKAESPKDNYVVYMRNCLYLFGLIRLIKNNCLIMEVNTNEKQEWLLKTKRGIYYYLKYYYKVIPRYLILKNVDGIVAVTNEIAELPEYSSIKRTVCPNGFDLRRYHNTRKLFHPERSIPQLVFIGSPQQEWHGVDKIIFLAQKTIGLLEFNIIGINKIEPAPSNIMFYGYLDEAEYLKVICNSDIGIGSLSFHKNKMNEACPLKVRTYLAIGLPIITAYFDTAFVNNKKEWVLELENNENNIANNISKIVDFCYQYKNYCIELNDLTAIDLFEIEKKRVDFFTTFFHT